MKAKNAAQLNRQLTDAIMLLDPPPTVMEKLKEAREALDKFIHTPGTVVCKGCRNLIQSWYDHDSNCPRK